MERLFVYGTLGPGCSNEHELKPIQGEWTPGTVRGHFHEEGWGATEGYPAIVIDPEGEVVHGHVYSSVNFARHWDRLDEFEGPAYQRIITDVCLEKGDFIKAYVYALRPVNGEGI